MMSRRLFTLSVILLPILAAVLKFDLVGRITIDTFLHFFLVPQHPNPFSIHPKSGPVTLFPLSWDADENREILERDLKDAVYVITGSSSGIGLATAKRIEQALGPKQKNRLIHAGVSFAIRRDDMYLFFLNIFIHPACLTILILHPPPIYLNIIFQFINGLIESTECDEAKRIIAR